MLIQHWIAKIERRPAGQPAHLKITNGKPLGLDDPLKI